MLAIQAVPPAPPLPPGSELSIGGSLEGIAAVVLLLGAGPIIAALVWPLIRAMARRIEGGAPASGSWHRAASRTGFSVRRAEL